MTAHQPRRVGMAKYQNIPPLLSKIGNKSRDTTKPSPKVDEPPLSSEDEEDVEDVEAVGISQCGGSNASQDSTHGQRPGSRLIMRGALLNSPSNSNDEKTARGSIAQTKFSRPAPTRTQQRARGKRSETIESLDSGAKRSDDDQGPSNKRIRCSNSPPSTFERGTGATAGRSGPGAHLMNEHGFARKTTAGTRTYGSKAKNKLKRRKDMEGAAAKQRADETWRQTGGVEAQAASKPQIQVPKPLDEPEKPSTGKLVVPKAVPWSSPTKTPGVLLTSRYPADDYLDKNSDSPQADTAASPTHFADFGRGAKGSDGKPEVVLSDVASDTEKSNGPLSDLEVIGSDTEVAAVCPWCGQPVDKSLLDDFSRGKRMNVRLQTRFCRQHKKQTAVETWQAKGYPEVDWEGLDRRFAAHRRPLLDIVNGKASHFRGILAQKIESGQARSMKKEGNMNPGYYGPRGFDLMCDYIVDEFGALLKERAVDDRVIAGRGSAAFIQTVLVAELAVRLIGDDMGVSAEEARGIMEESKALGEMVHDGA
ncbi:hypothetical protein OCS_03578 [Ophiocordyceps sinensis CO18]|uniref:Restriction of telomere capping protein 4 n=1 Tax=Ophiocordyceps sinensis (strain Co18 / CGMCC 3.14243) TaxID=911162 RepID=T5AG56_OPHSC|nr:hypothetical protein OCS_03578 [Ophiocordyceps sinensis CO18]